ncbi:MAG: hypothetical protein V4850_29390 [Myxococcota bacterium]
MRPVDDEIKAQRLAAWLSSPAGTAPPEDLDPEVLGAVWALAPDRAPAPRVSIDDIFSLVTEGPFARGAGAVEGGTTAEVVRFPGNVGDEASGEWDAEDLTYVAPTGRARLVAHPGGKVEAPVVAKVVAPVVAGVTPPPAAPIPPESSKVVPLARKAPSRAWMVPTLGLALAAAAATLIVVPTMGKLSPAGLVEQQEARDAMLAAPPPPPSAIAEVPAELRAEAPTEGSPASTPAPDVAVAQAPKVEAELREQPVARQAPADRGDASGRGYAQPTVGGVPELKENEGPSIASLPDTTDESVARRRDADISASVEEAASSSGGYATGGYGAGAPSTSTASTSSTPTRSQAPASEKAGKTYIPEAAGPSAPREAADDSLADGVVYDRDEAEQSVAATSAAGAKKDRKSGAAKPSSRSAASDDAPAASAPAPSAPAPSAPGAAASNTVTASARGSAWPNDYDAGWYRALADVAPIFDAARADEAAGRFDTALAGYRTLTADARPAVAQDAALRAAKALKALGRNAEALATVDTGLNRSGANTPFRASLYALRGDLLSLLGRASDAEAAWASAATLNEAR